MTDKPSNTEEEYFAREEIEKKRKLALQQAQATESKKKEELKKLHFMKCPKCGMDLQTVTKGSGKTAVEIDTCFNCHGIWLDAGELEAVTKMAGEENSGAVMKSIMGWFRK